MSKANSTGPVKSGMKKILEDIRTHLHELDQTKYHRYNIKRVAEIENKLGSMRDKLYKYKNSYTDPALSLYPEYYDTDFFKKIYAKKEFYKSHYAPVDTNLGYEKISESQCQQGKFKLTQNQVFFKNFMSSRTHYNGLLLYHGVGVGKSCAAISMAEQFRRIYEKPVLVLTPKRLKDNFKRQIFDKNNMTQCTGPKYRNMVPNYKQKSPELIEKYVTRLINENYKFLGFLEFANQVEHIEKETQKRYANPDQATGAFHNHIRQEYSNRVIIVDEVHNVRSEKEAPNKKALNYLTKVLSIAENVKLIMLTATPMYNGPKEIIHMLNFLLANDKKPLLTEKQVFDDQGNMTMEGKKKLLEASRGYISYMRGENPFSFPLRLYPNMNKDAACMKESHIPTHDINGSIIPESKRIKKLGKLLIVNKMHKIQAAVYEGAKPAVPIENNDEDSDGEVAGDEENVEEVNADDENEHENGKQNNELSNNVSRLLQISNIVYPNTQKRSVPTNQLYGNTGMKNCFDIIKSGGKGQKTIQYKYKKEVVEKFGEFLHPDNIGQYSAKLKSIVDYILNSEGIVFVYSYFIYSALLPLAIALEHAGFKRSTDTQILYSSETKRGTYKVNGKTARYSLLTRDGELHTDINTEILKIRAATNKNGQDVKVVLGTSVAAEGLDLKNIRQIHIVEPWFHMNKLEQVIGRAIRKCSHQDLPIPQRNVTIYHHTAILPKNKEKDTTKSKKHKLIETIDMRLYRISENKQTTIEQVERVLMSNAVDCNLNRNVLQFPYKTLNMPITLSTSQGVEHKNYMIGDREDDKHNTLQCIGHVNETKINKDALDSSTFHMSFIADEAEFYVDILSKYFGDVSVSTYEDARTFMTSQLLEFDEDVFKYALEFMLRHKSKIKNKNDIRGFLVYYGNQYMFQPLLSPEAFIPLNARYDYRANSQTEVLLDEKDMVKLDHDTHVTSRHNIDDNPDIADDVVPANKEKLKPSMAYHDVKTLQAVQTRANDVLEYILGDHVDKFRKRFEQVAVDYVLDRLSEQNFIKVVEECLSTGKGNKLTKLIKHSLESGDVLIKLSDGNYVVRDYFSMQFSKELNNPTQLSKALQNTQERKAGFWMVRPETHTLEIPVQAEIAQIVNDKKRIKNFDEIESRVKEVQQLKGFIGIEAKNNKGSIFKVVGLKENTSLNGTACGTGQMHTDDFKTAITSIDQEILAPKKKYNKEHQMCPIYELLLRSQIPKCFLRPFEYQVYRVLLKSNKSAKVAKKKAAES